MKHYQSIFIITIITYLAITPLIFAEDMKINLGTNDSSTRLSIQNTNSEEVIHIDSEGKIKATALMLTAGADVMLDNSYTASVTLAGRTADESISQRDTVFHATIKQIFLISRLEEI